ncbi:MAG: peptidase U32 family protein [Coprobacillaceae bacterium]
MKRKLELLAPAGSYEALVAAIQNGANAIYLGGSQFSARAFATNFSNEEIKEAVNYAHLRNVKIYVTVNTLYADTEFSELHTYLTYLYSINIDAIIVQDIVVLYLVIEYFPDFAVLMSKQPRIYPSAGVKFF